MDFSKVKEWLIPEGKVKSVSVGGVVIWKAKTEAEQLTAPTISLDGDILTITATDERTEEFVIFVDGAETVTVANEQEPETPETPDTPIEDPLYNTAWVLKDKFDSGYNLGSNGNYKDLSIEALFVSANESFYKIGGATYYISVDSTTKPKYTIAVIQVPSVIGGEDKYLNYYSIRSSTTHVYTSPHSSTKDGYWNKQAYRTIVVKSRITDEDGELLHNILKANATQIEYNPAEIEFTIDGVTYQGKENMLWEEWANSEYNTIGLTAYYQVMLGDKLLYRTGDDRQEQYNFAIIPNASYETRTPTGSGN